MAEPTARAQQVHGKARRPEWLDQLAAAAQRAYLEPEGGAIPVLEQCQQVVLSATALQ